MSRTVTHPLNARELVRLKDLSARVQAATEVYNAVLSSHCDRAEIDIADVEGAETRNDAIVFTLKDTVVTMGTMPSFVGGPYDKPAYDIETI